MLDYKTRFNALVTIIHALEEVFYNDNIDTKYVQSQLCHYRNELDILRMQKINGEIK